jgi:DNA-binding transcriptional MerR regulator
MVIKDFEVTKIYWSISEVATRFGVAQSLIRFWEKEFDELQPKKNTSGNRLFSQKDIEVFEAIYKLVKDQGMTLEGAKRKLKDNRRSPSVGTEMDSKTRIQGVINNLEALKMLL